MDILSAYYATIILRLGERGYADVDDRFLSEPGRDARSAAAHIPVRGGAPLIGPRAAARRCKEAVEENRERPAVDGDEDEGLKA